MFSRWIRGLALSLCVVGAAQAQVASLGKPIAVARPPAPAVGLGRPVALAPGTADDAVQPVSFTPRDPLPVARGAAPHDDVAVSQWRRAEPAVGLATRAQAEPLPVGPTPLLPGHGPAGGGGGPILSAPLAPPAAPCFGDASGAHGAGASCFPGAAAPCGRRLWLGVDFLLWDVRGDNTPPLLTTGSAADPIPGAIGQPGTRVLFGGKPLNDEVRSGVRVNAVYWFNQERCWGLDLSGFILPERQDRFSGFSPGDPVLARPIVDLLPSIFNTRSLFNQVPNPTFGQPNVERVADPADGTTFPDRGALAGGVDIVHKSTLWGYEANLRRGLLCGDNFNCDLFFGFRQLGLDESVSVTERLAVTEAVTGVMANGMNTILVPSGSRFVINDRFSAQNRFYGGQLGFDTEWRCNRWLLGLKGKVALGSTEQMVSISGFTARTPPGGATAVSPGGLLALPGANVGNYYRSVFGVVPELGLSVGYQFKPWLRGTLGYNFLYWNNVVRPGGAIDLGVNRNFQPGTTQTSPLGPARPAFRFDGSDLWAHGLTLGLEARF